MRFQPRASGGAGSCHSHGAAPCGRSPFWRTVHLAVISLQPSPSEEALDLQRKVGREVGLTRERVRQLEAEALTQLSAMPDIGGLRDAA